MNIRSTNSKAGSIQTFSHSTFRSLVNLSYDPLSPLSLQKIHVDVAFEALIHIVEECISLSFCGPQLTDSLHTQPSPTSSQSRRRRMSSTSCFPGSKIQVKKKGNHRKKQVKSNMLFRYYLKSLKNPFSPYHIPGKGPRWV